MSFAVSLYTNGNNGYGHTVNQTVEGPWSGTWATAEPRHSDLDIIGFVVKKCFLNID